MKNKIKEVVTAILGTIIILAIIALSILFGIWLDKIYINWLLN